MIPMIPMVPMVPIIPPITRELAVAVVKSFNLQSNGDIDFDIIGLERNIQKGKSGGIFRYKRY